LNTHGNDLADLDRELPALKLLRGVPFLIEGVVVVGPGQTEGRLTQGPVKTPRSVLGIPVEHRAERLYFLHATHFGTGDGLKIGSYRIHYVDGTTETLPLRDGGEIAEWWTPPVRQATEAPGAWRGESAAARRFGRITGYEGSTGRPLGIQLFLFTWENPHPEREIQSFDLITGSQASAGGARCPFLVAVTGIQPAAP
jgi:hypothetical protein